MAAPIGITPSPGSWSLRAATAADRGLITELMRRVDAHDGVPRVLTEEELAQELDGERIRFEADTMLAISDTADVPAVVGGVWVVHLPSESRAQRCFLIGGVDPAFRRQGIGEALMTWAIARSRDVLDAYDDSLPKVIRAYHYEQVSATARLFERLGLRPVRYADEMIRSLDQPLPPHGQRPTPEGIAIIPWPSDRLEEIRAEKNAAFEDHWGSAPTDADRWHEQVHGYGARPDLSFIAVETVGAPSAADMRVDGRVDGRLDGRVVAHCLCHRYPADDQLSGRRDGWIDSLGTLREWRGKGVATALIAHALDAFRADGLTHALLGVDSENPSGAAQLYEGLGFRRLHREVVCQLDMT
jgi:mycothiol synthase